MQPVLAEATGCVTPAHCSKSLLLWLPAPCGLVFLSCAWMPVQNSMQCFSGWAPGSTQEKIHRICLGAVVKRDEPVCPEEVQPRLEVLIIVPGRMGKAEGILQPLLFFTASHRYAMRRVEWQLHLSLSFILCPNKSAVGLLWDTGFCPLPPLICCSLQSRQLSSWKVQWRGLRFVAGITWKQSHAPLLITDAVLESDLIVKQIFRKEISPNQFM